MRAPTLTIDGMTVSNPERVVIVGDVQEKTLTFRPNGRTLLLIIQDLDEVKKLEKRACLKK